MDKSELNYLDSLRTIIGYQKYPGPYTREYKISSKLIMDSKETNEDYRPVSKRKKYLGLLGLLLLNTIDQFYEIEDYDYIITVPIYFEFDLPQINDVINYRESYILSILEKECDVKIIHHLLKKSTNIKMKTLGGYDERIEFAKRDFVINNKEIDLNNKSLLLIDDVSTTGATGESVTKLLKENLGVRTVDMIAVAKRYASADKTEL